MARIYRTTDRISVKIDDIVVKLSPLTRHQKEEIQVLMVEGRLKSDLRKMSEGTALALKYAVKSISGVKDSDGKPYELKFEGEYLSEESIDDLLNLEITEKLVLACSTLVNGVPKDFTDVNGNKIEGVEIIRADDKDESEKNA